MKQDFNIAEYARQVADQRKELIKIGQELAEERHVQQITALDAAYRQAVLDPNTVIPTYLMAAIHSLTIKIGDKR